MKSVSPGYELDSFSASARLQVHAPTKQRQLPHTRQVRHQDRIPFWRRPQEHESLPASVFSVRALAQLHFIALRRCLVTGWKMACFCAVVVDLRLGAAAACCFGSAFALRYVSVDV